MLSAENLCKQFPDKSSGLIRIQTVSHSDGIPERFLFLKLILKMTKKHEKLHSMQKVKGHVHIEYSD